MRARYYNPEIRRFINQDVVTGSIENSQSLNRYAYCQGNPVNYLDPFGLSPQSFGSWVGHTVLNLLSFVPVFGNAADAFNAIWYAYEGNYAEAIACAVGAIPLIGNLATGFKIRSKVVKGCNIAANGGKAAIGFYNGVQNVMNVDRMIRTGIGRWYDYLGQGVQFGLNMFVSAVGVSGAWNGISNLVDEINQGKVVNRAEEVSWRDTNSRSWEAQIPRTGEEWNKYFQDVYGAENVKWKAQSFEHIMENPQTLYGSSQAEIAQILGDGWIISSYGNSGTGWKFINNAHSDFMVFYHNADGIHGGAYYGFSSGSTGTVKLVGYDYVALPGDNATILQMP